MISVKLERAWEIELANRLNELKITGLVIINKYVLLGLVGYTNDASGGWESVREAFEDIGGDPKKLQGVKLDNGNVVLLTEKSTAVSSW